MISSTGLSPGGDRRLHLYRSVLSSRGPALELSSPTGGRPASIIVKALGSTFARFRSDALVSLISFRDVGGEVKDLVNWMGEHNSYAGWSDWSSMGIGSHTVKVASLAAARTLWPATDAQSQETPNPWPEPPDVGQVLPEQMRTLAPQAIATLARAAAPSPELLAKTLDEFRRPEPPVFESPIASLKLDESGTVSTVEPVVNPIANVVPVEAQAPGIPADPNAPPPPPALKELLFDVTAAPWKGDLGRYLREQVKPGDARVIARVSGNGTFNFSPVRLPDGTSLEVIVETSRVKLGVPPTWRAAGVGGVEALIDVKGGDLVLNGVEIQRSATANPKFLIRVNEGHLVLNRCRLYMPQGQRITQPGTGHLIAFRAPGTRPLPSRPWPFSSPIDKPVCRIIESVLITPGDVLHADVGRGMIALTECLVESGGTIFTLNPAKVAKNRFEADLLLERSTLAAEKSFVLLGAWVGSTPGPDRPWLVTSRETAYLSSFNPISKESVLLRVEPNSLSQGALFWQASNDAYEVMNFTARFDKPLTGNPYPDVYRQWFNFWGANHFRHSTGPSRGTKASVALNDRLKSQTATVNVSAGDLALDRDFHPGRTELDVGADVRILQVSPSKTPSRRPR